MKKVCLWLLILALLAMPVAAWAEESANSDLDSLSYAVKSGQITITGLDVDCEKFDIPENIYGLPVVGIGEKSFADKTLLTILTVPACITEIAENAFDNSPNLTISAPAGSAAAEFALAHSIPLLGGEEESVIVVDYRSDPEKITEVQNMLIQVGLMDEDAASGVFGSATIAAIAEFQEWIHNAMGDENIPVTGAVDSQTLTYLNIACRMNAQVGTGSDAAASAAEPTEEPTAEPTEEPTAEPTEEPTAEPTEEPTAEPTEEPAEEPTAEPTEEPAEEPTAEPTEEPTEEPTAEPAGEPAPEPESTDGIELDPFAEPEQSGETIEPSEETEEEEKPGDELIQLKETYSFTMQVDSNGMPWKQADLTGAIDVPVTVTVMRSMDSAYYTNRYFGEYVLKGNESGVELRVKLDRASGVTAMSLQDVLPAVMQNASGDTQVGYQYIDAEIGGATDSTMAPGTSKTVYKRYRGGEIDNLDRMIITYYQNGEPHLVRFSILPFEPADSGETYALGDKGNGVIELQQKLIAKGFLGGSADGDFGSNTEKAVRAAQKAMGMEETGIADYQFIHQLDNYEAAPSELETSSGDVDGEEVVCRLNDKSEDVRRIQEKLIEMGYLFGTPDGHFGEYTEEAVMKAQSRLGFEADGIVTRAFMEKLLGD